MSRGSSTRVDDGVGISEEAEFFGRGQDRLFGFRHLPTSRPPFAGVVMCDPILAQFRAHYRQGTLTARELVNRGVAVQRFHYRGMGNSDGDILAMSLDTMHEDAVAAANRLREAIGDVPIAYLGINVGGYAAARASQTGEMLIVDSPPPSGRQYFRNAVRAHGIYALKRPTADGLTIDTVHQQLKDGSRDVSLLGCRLGLPLFETLMESSLLIEMGDTKRPTLFVGLGEGGALKPEGERMRAELADKGLPVEVAIRSKADPFWYVENSAPENQPEINESAGWIVDWMHSQVSAKRGVEV